MSERVSPARKAAAYVLSRCRRFDAWSSQTLQTAREKYDLSPRDAALCSRICLSVLQNAALCDHYIDAYSSVGVSKMEPAVLDILRMGAVQLLFMDRIPISAAVDQSVEMAKRISRPAAGLVNAVLRRIAENRSSLPEIPCQGTARELSVLFSHPLWLCEKIVTEKGYPFARAFFEANNTQPVLTVSVNLARTDAVCLAKQLEKSVVASAMNPLSPVSVDLLDAGAVEALPGFQEGLFFVQDAAAAYSVVSAAPESGSHVLDLCAAPGGKSLLCASLMRDSGDILSCDLHEKKLRLVSENARRLGFNSIRTAQMDASKPAEELYDGFDLVIADVPCSGMGVIRKKPEIRYKRREELDGLPQVQLRILQSAAKCVSPGGTLLYSTCTVLHEENEDVISAFSPEDNGFSVAQMRTIWPQEYNTDGFFFCRMIKNDVDQ